MDRTLADYCFFVKSYMPQNYVILSERERTQCLPVNQTYTQLKSAIECHDFQNIIQQTHDQCRVGSALVR